jgi:hypothetical protein
LEKTGFLEEPIPDGDVSRCRVIMSRLPPGFDPALISSVTVLAAPRRKKMRATRFDTRGLVDRGSITFTAWLPIKPQAQKANWIGRLIVIALVGKLLSLALRFIVP